jgi:hypothetical protein
MKLNILLADDTFEGLVKKIEEYFDVQIRTFRSKMSLFEQYEVRPIKKYIPKIWQYRIIGKNGYKFGRVEDESSNA